MRGYLDGQLVQTTSIPTPPLQTAQTTVTLGASRPGIDADPFQGYLGDLRLQTGQLTDAQVLNNFNVDAASYGVAPVPEPATMSLFGVLGAGMLFLRRRRAS